MKLLAITALITLLTCNFAFATFQNTTIFCIDNDTLQENISVYSNANLTNLTLNTHCFDGCDNKTMVCNSPAYQQDIFNIVIVVIFIAGCVLIYRFGRGR